VQIANLSPAWAGSGSSGPTANFSCRPPPDRDVHRHSTDTGGTINSYSWNFGDARLDDQEPDHTYAAAGTYTVSER